nr:hypothetical protein [Tanacetum cinerariifolium]
WGGNAAGYGEAPNRVGNVNQGQARPGQARPGQARPGQARPGQARPGQARTVKCYNCNGTRKWSSFGCRQLLFLAADPITDEAGPSYDLDILSKVQDHDQYLDDTCAYQEEHVMYDSVQLDHVVDSHADHTSVSNMILYDQETLTESIEGTPQFGLERPRVYSDLNSVERDR